METVLLLLLHVNYHVDLTASPTVKIIVTSYSIANIYLHCTGTCNNFSSKYNAKIEKACMSKSEQAGGFQS